MRERLTARPAQEQPVERPPSAADLPFGALPARPYEHSDDPSGSGSQQPAPAVEHEDEPDREPDREPEPAGEYLPQPASEGEVAISRTDGDDDVHFGVAAKALGVSRKTVERMVKRGQLDRGPSGAPATVSKRGLVAELEQRRRDVSGLMQASAGSPQESASPNFQLRWPEEATAELQEVLRPFLEPLLDEFVAARTRAAVLEHELERIEARAAEERARDELLLALATGNWRQRRRARRAALRHYVLGDNRSEPSS